MSGENLNQNKDALDYHKNGKPGKLEIIPSTQLNSAQDLSLAYSPGVAIPCLEIEKNPETAYDYTTKGNLVAVISNGTAVLGIGNIGAKTYSTSFSRSPNRILNIILLIKCLFLPSRKERRAKSLLVGGP